jgi:benzoylformate decarboxylase
LEGTPGVPGLDIPSIDIVALATGYGCDPFRVATQEAIAGAAMEGEATVLEVPISRHLSSLV